MISLSVNVNSNGLLETPQMASTSKQALLVTVSVSGNEIKTTNVVTLKQEVITTSTGRLADLLDVDITGKTDGEPLVYDETTHKYVFEPLSSNNIAQIDGGTF